MSQTFNVLQYVLPVAVVLGGYIGYFQINFWFRERRFIKLQGTQRVVKVPTSLPLGIDIIVTMVHEIKRHRLPEYFRDLFEKLGNTFDMKLLGESSILTREPRNIHAILTTQFEDYAGGAAKSLQFGPFLGDAIFTLDGTGWEYSRAILRPQFTRNQLSQLQNLEEHLQVMMDCIPDGEVVDMQSLFYDLTIDTGTDFLCGESCNALERRRNMGRKKEGEYWNQPEDDFAKEFNTSQKHLLYRAILGGQANLWNPKELQSAVKFCRTWFDEYVKRAIEDQKSGGTSRWESDDANEKPSKYIFLKAIAKETQDPVFLRDSLLNILLAARDTTASLLAWVFYVLVRYPDVEQRLRQTILKDFGEGNADDSKPITFESLKNCQYLRWVLNETLRLYPSVPMSTRIAVRDTTLPTGGGPDQKQPIFVPKGVTVIYDIYSMHRRVDIWGPDANWFRPERWGEKRNKGDFNYFDYLPFNGGPRICIGQQFALTEASYTIVRMFQRFKRFEAAEANEWLDLNLSLTLTVGGKGCHIKCYRS
ncbi:Protein kinase alk2 [Orbilia brochopaga]|uniref:Protein kinase alk2 n=1 Tax=Orbilia brochopaga TaxID=3140254 RepID=A0AAV9UX82_9PEZI